LTCIAQDSTVYLKPTSSSRTVKEDAAVLK